MSGLVLESLGWALLHLLWQGALVAAVLAAALRVLGRRAAVARYALAYGALVMMLVLPVATGWRHAAKTQSAPSLLTSAGGAAAAPEALEQMTSGQLALPTASEPQPLPGRVLALVGGHLSWLVLAWGLGVAACSLRLLASWLRLRQLVLSAVPAPLEWQQRLDGLARRLGLKRAVRLLQSTALEVPSAMGWLRPVVLLPACALSGLPVRQLEMILAHELAHIRRYDFVVNLAQTLVETLLFYHPAVWWVSRAVRVEREHCCDDIAASTSGNPIAYARALTALEQLRVLPSLTPSPALSALGGSLPERVRRLVASPASRCSSRWVAGASVLTLVSSLAVAAPVTALMLPAEAARVLQTASPSSPPSVVAPSPAPSPAPALKVEPKVEPAPVPSRLAAANPHPNPNPNPNPNPRPARDEDEDEDEDDHDDEDEVDGRTRVGESTLSVDQLVSMKEAGVSPETVETMKAMGYEPTVLNLVQFGHAGITPEYVKDMNARFGQKLSAEELVEMKHLDVTPAWLEAMKAQGFAKATPEELVSARAVGVSEDYLRELKAAGYTGLSLEIVTELRAVGVKPATIAELSKAGYGKLDADELVQFQALGVSPDYIRALREAGLKDLSAEKLVELRAVGVDAGFIRQMREAGLETLDVDELVRLRTSGIDADFIHRMKQPRKQP